MTTGAPHFGQLTIIGLGLIGGSVALAARARKLCERVVGVDRADVASSAAARGAVDAVLDIGDWERVDKELESSDLVVLATPVSVICTLVGRVLDRAPLVTDCGSTKRAIVRAAAKHGGRGRFVPGHPMAGDPRSGVEHARPELFEGRPWILCPESGDEPSVRALESFVGALGAEPRRMAAAVHDRAVAVTSHVPQLLASVLAVLASERDAAAAAGPAFESATRVAGGSEPMWRDILATNADEVGKAVRDVADELHRIARALEASPEDLRPALEVLERARRARPRR